MRVLLVEDQADLARNVTRSLQRADHEVTVAATGPDAVKQATERHHDLIVLDVNLPGFDGFEVLNKLKENKVLSRVIMLTARDEVSDRVKGLKAGADDYLTKPFALEELLARVDALGRRGAANDKRSVLDVGNIVMDLERRKVTKSGINVVLSPREFEVFQILMREPGRTFSRDEICERIWEREHEYDTRTVEIFIMRLRKKLHSKDETPIIRTVRGVGYCIDPTE